jgi:hypothetical protein
MFFTLGVPCIHPVYFGLRPFAPFQYILLIKKKKLKVSFTQCVSNFSPTWY